ncbi:MAG: threonine synthase [Candidatus Altiarchaeota archaeon]|nr:threonine synthase [Candidatus Altiarchaeota archaeon]
MDASDRVVLKCIDCGREYQPIDVYECECGGLLDAHINLDWAGSVVSKALFDKRLGSREKILRSGIWRYKELVNPMADDLCIITRPEGNTGLYENKRLLAYTGLSSVMLKHEGENPTGSFKDRGMSPGVSEAVRLRMKVVACASTGNTSASMAAYASMAGLKPVVFIPEGKIAYGKLAQALAYGSKVIQVRGNFDDAMKLVRESSRKLGMYLLNSVNPWRIEGQKTIMIELMHQLSWNQPDWVCVPAGNLGNTSAFGKALEELKALGFIEKMPRIASIQADGANPFYLLWKKKAGSLTAVEHPDTIATAIKIGNPVSWKKALRSINATNGVVEQVSDQEIMDAKAIIDGCGICCEPASAASLAGARKLVKSGVIKRDESVVCVITGNILKDPEATVKYHLSELEGITPKYANAPTVIDSRLEEVERAINAP